MGFFFLARIGQWKENFISRIQQSRKLLHRLGSSSIFCFDIACLFPFPPSTAHLIPYSSACTWVEASLISSTNYPCCTITPWVKLWHRSQNWSCQWYILSQYSLGSPTWTGNKLWAGWKDGSIGKDRHSTLHSAQEACSERYCSEKNRVCLTSSCALFCSHRSRFLQSET